MTMIDVPEKAPSGGAPNAPFPFTTSRLLPRTRRLRVAAVSASLAAVVGAFAFAWPTQRFAEEPGPVLQLATRVKVSDPNTKATPINGSYDGLTVGLVPLNLGHLVIHALTRDPSPVVPASDVAPPNVDPAAYGAYEKAAYVDGSQIAAAVAEKSLGYPVVTNADGLKVYGVAAGSPAAPLLKTGDVITAVNGQPANSTSVLAAAVTMARSPIALTLTRNGVSQDVSVTPAVTKTSTTPIIGVVAAPANPAVNLPVAVTSDAGGVSGPSAGLMMGLTVYDELSAEDLAAGRVIAGTGTLDIDGTVGEIGGIQSKARAAIAAHAQLFLAPASQAADARAVVGNKMPVIGVSTFADALAALRAAS